MDDLRQLERQRVWLEMQHGRSGRSASAPAAPLARTFDAETAELERKRARLPQRAGATDQAYQRAMAASTLRRYEEIARQMPEGSEGRKLITKSIEALKARALEKPSGGQRQQETATYHQRKMEKRS
ncbi:MAG: hypothetical protein KF893_25535 [Caldilineaceae bacterium]|nr:hypothetical protein [Caldilineaceae bacterium]